MIYRNFIVTPMAEGARYACQKCEEEYVYSLNADVDVLNSELDSHVCEPALPRRDWSEWAKGQWDMYKARKAEQEKVEAGLQDKPVKFSDCDGSPSETVNHELLARIRRARDEREAARILEGR
jgi:hypothetical protein